MVTPGAPPSAGLHAVATRPSGRRGKSADPLGDDEGITTEHDRDVMMPADETSPFVVVESQLALEFLVDALGPPALFDDAHDLLAGHAAAKARQIELGRMAVALGPFEDKPYRLA
jgi:hypothetical protein